MACRKRQRCSLAIIQGVRVDFYTIPGFLGEGHPLSITKGNPLSKRMSSVDVIPVDSTSDRTKFFISQPLRVLPGHLELFPNGFPRPSELASPKQGMFKARHPEAGVTLRVFLTFLSAKG